MRYEMGASMDIREISDAIRNSVSAIEVGKALGLNVDRHGRCPCPFHHGDGFNCKLYPGNRGFYCFVCHESGDCIHLVQGVVPDIKYVDAMWWVNDNFGLGYRSKNEKPSIMYRAKRSQMKTK